MTAVASVFGQKKSNKKQVVSGPAGHCGGREVGEAAIGCHSNVTSDLWTCFTAEEEQRLAVMMSSSSVLDAHKGAEYRNSVWHRFEQNHWQHLFKIKNNKKRQKVATVGDGTFPRRPLDKAPPPVKEQRPSVAPSHMTDAELLLRPLHQMPQVADWLLE